MTLQVYNCGSLRIDNFWEVGDGHFHTYVFVADARGLEAYRDGSSLGSDGCQGVPEIDRTNMYIGGSTCVGDGRNVYTSHMELEWFQIWDREY